jgi:hypothetical protein
MALLLTIRFHSLPGGTVSVVWIAPNVLLHQCFVAPGTLRPGKAQDPTISVTQVLT